MTSIQKAIKNEWVATNVEIISDLYDEYEIGINQKKKRMAEKHKKYGGLNFIPIKKSRKGFVTMLYKLSPGEQKLKGLTPSDWQYKEKIAKFTY